jgi:hypothetical protein
MDEAADLVLPEDAEESLPVAEGENWAAEGAD